MKKHEQPKGNPFARRAPRLLVAGGLLAITLGVVAGVSKQSARTQQSDNQIGNTLVSRALNDQVTAGRQEGQIKPLTQEEAQKLATALKELANQSSDGLRQVRHADGTVSMDFQGRFQNVAIAKRNEDGSLSESCIDNPESGAAFFGLDPKLIGLKKKPTSAASSASPDNK